MRYSRNTWVRQLWPIHLTHLFVRPIPPSVVVTKVSVANLVKTPINPPDVVAAHTGALAAHKLAYPDHDQALLEWEEDLTYSIKAFDEGWEDLLASWQWYWVLLGKVEVERARLVCDEGEAAVGDPTLKRWPRLNRLDKELYKWSLRFPL